MNLLPLKQLIETGFYFSEETDEIFPAFINFQRKIGPVYKDNSNPFYNSDYADLKEVWRAIKDPLHENKLGIMQFNNTLDWVTVKIKEKVLKTYQGKHGPYDKLIDTGKFLDFTVREIAVTTVLIHESGQRATNIYIGTPEDNTDQARGKTITYGRRYSLMPILGISPEDNDGNPEVKRVEAPAPKVKKTTKTPKTKEEKVQELYFKDTAGNLRYRLDTLKLNDKYQKENDLILDIDLTMIRDKLNKNCIDWDAFCKWTRSAYNVEFYDLKKEWYPDIYMTLKDNPEKIK